MDKHTKFKEGDLITSLGGFGLERIDSISPRKANYNMSSFNEFTKEWEVDDLITPVYIIDRHYQLYDKDVHIHVHDNPLEGCFDW